MSTGVRWSFMRCNFELRLTGVAATEIYAAVALYRLAEVVRAEAVLRDSAGDVDAAIAAIEAYRAEARSRLPGLPSALRAPATNSLGPGRSCSVPGRSYSVPGRSCSVLQAAASVQVGSCFSPGRSCQAGGRPELNSGRAKAPASGRSISASGRRQAGAGFVPEFSGRSISASGRFIPACKGRPEKAVGGGSEW